ncbi:MAG: Dps family protein [Porphyromonadaceae bacterium]|nr:Dps family protein [Porphyromonadaceae bacterium]
MEKILSITGIDAAKSVAVVDNLKVLLANFQVYYTNLRGFHWHITGNQFFMLHEEFEKMYDDTAEKVDELAERILQLGASPENRFSELLKVSQIDEVTGIEKADKAIDNIFDSIKKLIAQERMVLGAAQEANDEVTVALMGDYLAEQEKLVWMLTAYTK